MRPERLAAALLGALLAPVAAALPDFDGVALGASEQAVRSRFPNAHCQPLQWESRAADRRCDDSRVRLDGVPARITVYLKAGAVEAFDVRFDSRYASRLAKLASERFGSEPAERRTEKAHVREWRAKSEHGLLTAQPGDRRASLLVWRGDFYDEIYKVR